MRGSRVLVTGAAGFIGSRTCEVLIDRGAEVIGVDAFTDYYDREIKQRNLGVVGEREGFSFHELDLADRLDPSVIEGVDAVVHLAAMPGLMRSWTDVASYARNNIVATAALLDSVVASAPGARFIQVSTSSVYGLEATGDETAALRPASPYGITKLAAEQLVAAYREQSGLDAIVLRYFSVYGPRQRPDMAYHIFCDKLLAGEPITVFGDGSAVRSNTFVDDCVDGTLLALAHARSGETYNVGGGTPITVNDAIATLGEVSGRKPDVRYVDRRKGDQLVTVANFSKASAHFGYAPTITPLEGLARQWHAHVERR